MSSISKNDNSEFDFDLQGLNQGYISNRLLSDLDSLDSLLDDVPANLPDPLSFASISAPELERDTKRLNATFKATLDLYQFMIDQSRASEADDLTNRIREIRAEFDERHGEQSHKRYIDRALVRRFLDLTTRRSSINPAFEVPRSSQIERVLTPAIDGVLTPSRDEFEGVLTPTIHPSKFRKLETKKSENTEQIQFGYTGRDTFQPVRDFNTYSTPHNEIEEIEKIALSEITPAATQFTTRQNSLNSTLQGEQRSQSPELLPASLYGAFGDFDAPQLDRADAGSAKPTPFTVARDHALSSQPERKDLQHFLDAKNLTDPFQHRWKSLTDRKRKFVLSSMLAHENNGWFFSLDFHEDRAAELMKSSTPAMLFADRHLRKHLQACLGYVPAIALALEFDSKGKLHTHGICIPDMERSDPGFKDKLAEALRLSASRTYKRKELYPTLANVKPIFEPLGLAAYILKDLSRTQKKISKNEVNVVYLNREMKKITLSYHELARKSE
ncbi:hypothetical protein JAU75_01565 [Ochrobactrum sp. Q0168]|uniref:hypothetical protein n=1 Tax=Ochrobactrum sp. Q0168 TaxID=2793241 RepID=UPI0018EA796B|nr:hypothetical protein [Ochrobactrum sp. Q0168]